jgi:hypothetical protein
MNNDKASTENPINKIAIDFHAGAPVACEIKIAQQFQRTPVSKGMSPMERVVLTMIFAALAMVAGKSNAKGAVAGNSLDLKVLVIAAQTNDFPLSTIREALDFAGTPYDVHVATENPGSLTLDTLRAGTRGFYNGVIVTSTSLGYTPDGGITWLSALSTAEWAALEQYERDFGARHLNWYGFPGPNQGLNWSHASADTTATPLTANWTAAATTVFPYLNTSNTLTISNVWTYLATPLDTNTTVWLNDAQGNALLSSATLADGREVATMTFDSANYLISSSVVRHGLIRWVSKGMFLGQRHTYLVAQIDDVFLADDIFTGGEYRQNSNDWHATITWQNNYNQRPSGVNFRYDMAFNGQGTEPSMYPGEDLTAYAAATESVFKWISHTYTHPYLTSFTYGEAMAQIVPNNQKAVELGLTHFTPASMVTPNITGLENPAFLNAAYDAGIRYLVTDTSIDYHRPAGPNQGIPNWYVPGIMMIPRHANNLFYNVSTPAQWEAEYNSIFNSFWGRDLNYAEILENQSDLIVGFLLKGDVSPHMFHQPNLRDFNGQGNTLLGDLFDRVADKYEHYYNFPFLSPTQDELGELVAGRNAYNASGVTATSNADGSIDIAVTNAATIPVTGLRTASSELYAGEWITYVQLGAGQSVKFVPGTDGIYSLSSAANTAPTATSATYNVAAGSTLPIVLTGTDPENNILTFNVTDAPALGSVTGVEPNVTFLPPLTQTGTVTFDFTANDGEFTSTGTITVNITANQNTAPTATDATHTTAANTPVQITLTGTDPQNDELTFTVTSESAMGEIEVNEFVHANITYSPNPGMAGTDSFTFSATDGQFTSTGTITVNITGVPTGTNVTVNLDGNLAEWAAVSNAGSGLNNTNVTGNQIDLVELKVTHDDDNVYVAYNNKQPIVLNWGYTLYIDSDQDPSTGFAMWEIGADFVIQGNGLYAYSGTGTDWAWTWVQAASATVGTTAAEIAFPRSAIGNPDSFHYTFYGDNYAFGGTTFEFIPASAWAGGKSYLRYNLVAPPQELVTVDGNLADWSAITPLATDRNETTLTNSPINIRKLYLANDTNKFFLAYENQNDITLNWGYTTYLDTDATKSTGFNHWNVGADYVIQGNEIFKYAGTGNDWAWTWVGSMESVVSGNVMEASFPKAALNNPTGAIRVIFEGDNAAFGATGVDTAPNNLNGNTTQPGYLTYQVQ